MKETILVFSAHPDDEILGCGGTIARYSKDGNNVISIIFLYGESSHPHIKNEITRKIRVKESQKADKIVGCKETIFLGLSKVTNNEETIKLIKNMIKKYKPKKIFTHTINDPHPEHNTIHHIIIKAADELKFKSHIYTYDIWNPISIRKRNTPKLIVDISNTIKIKAKAMKCFKSQGVSMFNMVPAVYVRAVINGINYNHKFAEVFNKIR